MTHFSKHRNPSRPKVLVMGTWTAMALVATLIFTGFNLATAQHQGSQQNDPSANRDGTADDTGMANDADGLRDPPTANDADDPEGSPSDDSPPIPKPLDTYMGRQIAQTMHYTGAQWLIRDRREREERCSLMLANLGVKRAMAICDMGCGNGFHTLKLAEMTGPQGHVVGVDVQPQMLMLLRNRMEEMGIENVTPVLGSYHNPRLPPNSLDLILLVDVYHEFSHPQQMLSSMRKSLKPGGVIVLVEYRQEDPDVPIKPKHKMSKAQVDKELTANGFKRVRSYDKLPWQHMLFYGIAETTPSEDPKN